MFGSAPVLGGRGSRVGSSAGGVVGNGGGGGSAGAGGGVVAGGGRGGAVRVVSSYLSSSSSVVSQAARPAQIHNGPLLENGGSRRLLRGARLGQDFEVGYRSEKTRESSKVVSGKNEDLDILTGMLHTDS